MNLAPLWIKGENPHLCIPSGKRGEITERGEGVRQQQRELLENAAAAGNEQQQELDKEEVEHTWVVHEVISTYPLAPSASGYTVSVWICYVKRFQRRALRLLEWSRR
jgi:hypothetical protein